MHQPVRTTFKLFPTNGIFGSLTLKLGQTFRSPVSPLLTYLYEMLEKYSFSLTRSKSFSLVNINAPKHDLSIGYSEIDFGSFADGALMLTFALVPTPLKNLKVTSKYIPLRSHDFLWGRPDKDAEYITIVLDQYQLNKFFTDTIEVKMLNSLYNCVGLCSKSFITNPRGWYNSPVYDNTNLETLRTKYLTKTAQFMFKNVPVGFWIYNKYIWQDYSHLIVPSIIDSNFYKYFTVHILSVLPPQLNGDSLDWVYRDTKSGYTNYIREGLISLLGNWKSSTELYTLTDSEFCVLHLIDSILFDEDGFQSTDDESEALDTYQTLMNIAQSDDTYLRSRFFETFTDVNGSVFKLIVSDEQIGFRLKDIINATRN